MPVCLHATPSCSACNPCPRQARPRTRAWLAARSAAWPPMCLHPALRGNTYAASARTCAHVQQFLSLAILALGARFGMKLWVSNLSTLACGSGCAGDEDPGGAHGVRRSVSSGVEARDDGSSLLSPSSELLLERILYTILLFCTLAN